MNTAAQIIEGLAVPVIVVNSDLEVIARNGLAQQAFCGLDQAGGFGGFLSKTDGLKDQLQQTLRSGQVTKVKIRPRAGFRLDYVVTIKNIGAIDGANAAVVLMTFEDRSALNDLKAMRIGFVANVSHEIRSPLTAISGFIETLQGPAIEDIDLRTRFLGMMAKEVTRMTNLVSDLLSLSQVEAKERRALKHRVALNTLIATALETTAPLAEKSGKRLVVAVGKDLPAVMGRQDDLLRVLINLLENAIHYSGPQGHIHLTAQVLRGKTPIGQNAICICIKDDGEGIPAAEIPHLTERFYRVDKSRSRNLGGTGLGLAIVKHILVRHRGRLEIESTLGQGSSFCIYLPIARAE